MNYISVRAQLTKEESKKFVNLVTKHFENNHEDLDEIAMALGVQHKYKVSIILL